MAQQWYPRYPGDYARDTQHLTMLEHGAYSLLLDYYYANGGLYTDPCGKQGTLVGTNVSRLYRICRATTRDEQQAVDTVLEQYFPIINGRHTNSKADRIIEKNNSISDKRRVARAARGGVKTPANVPTNAGTNVPTNEPANARHNQNQIYSPPTPPRGKGFKKSGEGEGKGVAWRGIEQFLGDEDRQEAKKVAPGWDLYHLIRLYDDGIIEKTREIPDRPAKAFIGWCRAYTKGKSP